MIDSMVVKVALFVIETIPNIHNCKPVTCRNKLSCYYRSLAGEGDQTQDASIRRIRGLLLS